MTVNTKLNARQTVTMEIDGKMDECLRGTNAMLSFKGSCSLCKGTDITLQTKMAKEFSFIEFVCSCGARAQWGQYKKGGYFLKEWEIYKDKGVRTQEMPDIDVGTEEAPF